MIRRIITEVQVDMDGPRDGYARIECPSCGGTGRKRNQTCGICVGFGTVWTNKP